jgi:hypothetical protein
MFDEPFFVRLNGNVPSWNNDRPAVFQMRKRVAKRRWPVDRHCSFWKLAILEMMSVYYGNQSGS